MISNQTISWRKPLSLETMRCPSINRTILATQTTVPVDGLREYVLDCNYVILYIESVFENTKAINIFVLFPNIVYLFNRSTVLL